MEGTAWRGERAGRRRFMEGILLKSSEVMARGFWNRENRGQEWAGCPWSRGNGKV